MCIVTAEDANNGSELISRFVWNKIPELLVFTIGNKKLKKGK